MAAKLLSNGTVLSFDDQTQSINVLNNTSILVVDGRIEAIGKNVEQPPEAEVIDVTNKILTPGFINTHTHMWETAMRTMAPDTTLAEYFLSNSPWSPAIKGFSKDDIYISSLEGYLEGLNGGVTSYVEHAHSNWDRDAVKGPYDAAVDSGARVWWCHSVEDREGISAQEQWDYIGTLGDRTKDNHPLVTLGLAYDGLHAESQDDVNHTKEMVRKHNLEAITIHSLGGPWPAGNEGPATAEKFKLQDLNIPIVFSHGGFVTDKDRAALRQHDWNLSITPESEMHYGHGQSTSKLVLDHASLGIDTNWTFSGDILTQARLWLQHLRGNSFTATLEKGLIPRQTSMSVNEAFLLATRQGGRAVRRDDIGVLRVGARADIAVFKGDSPNLAGWTNPVAAVMLHANVGDIEHVLVDGEFRKRDGKLILKEGDWAAFVKEFAEVARRVQREHPGPVPLPEKFGGFGELMAIVEFGDVEEFSTTKQA